VNFPDIQIALETGHLAGLGTDVYHTEPFPYTTDQLLQNHPHVIATPHIGGVTEISYQAMAEIVAENLIRIYEGNEPFGCQNLLLIAEHCNNNNNNNIATIIDDMTHEALSEDRR
jgi:phosphoglycerate dehydrogenase-like enzyme